MRYACPILVLMLGLSSNAAAQHQHHGKPVAGAGQHETSDSEAVGWVPREILVRPAPLRPGIGPVHEKVSTSSRQAQAFYDQGMAYLHSYVWIEAARSFNQALRHDPKLAMAYVGLSRAYSGLTDPRAAREAVEKARSLAAGAAGWERRRIELRAQQLDAIEDIDNQAKLEAYRKAIDRELESRPNDIELLLVRGNAEESNSAGRGQRGLPTAVAFYERVLKIQPDNPAAHHYLVHTFEGTGELDKAVAHGEVYARVTPNIAHAQHMYGHDLQKVDRNAEAIAQFRKAAEIEKRYYAEEKIDAKYDWHHIHNLDLMSISHAYLGQMKAAEALWREAFASTPTSGFWEAYQAKWPELLLERGRAEEALRAAQELEQRPSALGRTMGHVMAGRAYLRLGQAERAGAELEAAEKEAANIPEFDPEPLEVHPRRVPEFQMKVLRAEIALRAGDKEAEEKMRALLINAGQGFRSADATGSLFLMQLVADDARALGKPELADFATQQMLKFDPNYAGGHYELGLAAEQRGDAQTAQRELATAERLWAKADPDLPELASARQKQRRLRAGQ